MDVKAMLSQAQDTLTVRKIFGEPIERDGVLVIPAAKFMGGGGGGDGSGPAVDGKTADGSGGGFGVRARPVGVYVVRDGNVSWQPAVDVTRIALGGQIVAIVALLVLRTLIRKRRR
jgi:uncharacterized spore protein YtfJ